MFALPFLIIDGVYLYIILTAFLIVTLVTIEYEKPGWCTTMIVLTLALLEFYSPYHPVRFAMAYPLAAAIYVATYIAFGVVWIVLKWYSHVNAVSRAFQRRKPAYTAKLIEAYRGGPDYLNHMPNDYVRYDLTLTEVGNQRVLQLGALELGERVLPFQVNEHKTELYLWWIGWPLSLFWTVLNDPIRRVWWAIYNRIGDLLQRISDRAFKID